MTRVAVFGTGALASLFGARLARTGLCEVTLVGTWRAAIDRINLAGLAVSEASGEWTVPASAATLDRPPRLVELALVLVKSHQSASVAPALAHSLAQDGLALTLQNGLGNAETLAQGIGRARVALGVTYVGATLLGPGHVRTTGPGTVVVGAEAHLQPQLAQIAALLGTAGFPCDLAQDFEPRLWRKLALNCAVNPLGALLGVPNGELLTTAAVARRLEAAANEVAAVAAARGVALGDDLPAWITAAIRDTAPNRCSMLQDLDRGAATEIEALNGAVIREAQRLGIAVPENRRLYAEVRARESARPGSTGPDRFTRPAPPTSRPSADEEVIREKRQDHT